MCSKYHRLCVALVLVGACGDATTEAEIADAACSEGVACATWIGDYEREIVSKISGESAIAEGLTITSRFTVAERDATRRYIVDELARFALTPTVDDYGSGANVIARLPATMPSASVILLGCHFDGIEASPAAGDDGTGVALVLAAARYFQSQEQRSNEMIFAFFDQEEGGLIGSQAYATKLRAEQPDLAAAHIFDLISWDEDGDGSVELWSPSAELEALYRSVGDDLGIAVHAVDFDSSDHASFIGSGFSSVGVSEEFVSGDFNPNYHTPEDSFENVNFDYLERISGLAFEVASRAQ